MKVKDQKKKPQFKKSTFFVPDKPKRAIFNDDNTRSMSPKINEILKKNKRPMNGTVRNPFDSYCTFCD